MTYRKVDTRIWNDAKVRTFTDDGQLAFLFLLTHPAMTALGAMRATHAGLASERGWSEKRWRRAIGPAVTLGMVEVNEPAAYIGLPKFLKYNEPNGPNQVTKAWLEALDLIPECPEKRRLIARCRTYLDGKSDDFRHAIGGAIWHAFAMPCPIQEQEQEQEQETPPPTPSSPEGGALASGSSADGNGAGPAWPSPEALVIFYNAATPDECPSVEKLSPARREKARRYLTSFPDRGFWERAFREIHASPFLRGHRRRDGHSSFVATLDWLLTKGKDGTENVVKVAEGQYRG